VLRPLDAFGAASSARHALHVARGTWDQRRASRTRHRSALARLRRETTPPASGGSALRLEHASLRLRRGTRRSPPCQAQARADGRDVRRSIVAAAPRAVRIPVRATAHVRRSRTRGWRVCGSRFRPSRLSADPPATSRSVPRGALPGSTRGRASTDPAFLLRPTTPGRRHESRRAEHGRAIPLPVKHRRQLEGLPRRLPGNEGLAPPVLAPRNGGRAGDLHDTTDLPALVPSAPSQRQVNGAGQRLRTLFTTRSTSFPCRDSSLVESLAIPSAWIPLRPFPFDRPNPELLPCEAGDARPIDPCLSTWEVAPRGVSPPKTKRRPPITEVHGPCLSSGERRETRAIFVPVHCP